MSDLDHQQSAGTGQQAAGAGTKELSIEQHSIDYVPWSERRGKRRCGPAIRRLGAGCCGRAPPFGGLGELGA